MTKISYFQGVIVIILLLTLGCESKQNQSKGIKSESVVINSFKNNLEIDQFLEPVDIDTELFQVRTFITSNDYLFALCADKDTLIRVFDINSLDYLGGFGYPGEGPEDLEFHMINASSFNVFENKLFITDRKYFRTILLDDLKDNIQHGDLKVIEKIPVPGSFIPVNDAFIKSDGNIYGVRSSTSKHLTVLNPKDLKIRDTLDFPSTHKDIPASAYHHLYRNNLQVSLNSNMVALAYLYFPMLRVYDFTKNSYLQVQVKPKNPQIENIPVAPNGRSIDNSNMFRYYYNVSVSNNLIAALYEESGFIVKDGAGQRVSFDSPKMHIMDWSGSPEASLAIPTWVNVYTITPDGSHLIFFHPEEENKLYKVKLSELL
ncbi:hypothetical protein [Roseivirga pacifica]|uniref:hypothetical protein n=1 Tax=Roseivirga pacifica TaxID=1267423 RepID=UPI003BAEAB2F